MWTDDLLIVMAQPYAAFELAPDGRTYTFQSLTELCAWMLQRKGALKLSLRDTHLVWGAAPLDQRATVTVELRGHSAGAPTIFETWRLTTQGDDATAIVAAVKAYRAARKAAA